MRHRIFTRERRVSEQQFRGDVARRQFSGRVAMAPAVPAGLQPRSAEELAAVRAMEAQQRRRSEALLRQVRHSNFPQCGDLYTLQPDATYA